MDVNVSVLYDWSRSFENLALRLAPDGVSPGAVPDALALMHLALPPAGLDAPLVRLATLRPISRADLYDPNADCRWPYSAFTQPLLGYHFLPIGADLNGDAAIVARINLTGVVYYRPSRRLFHCIGGVPPYTVPQWVSAARYCEDSGLPYHTNAMSADGRSLLTVFCHATAFMVAEDPNEAAVCVAGRYGCDCAQPSQYDTSLEFMAVLATSAFLCAVGVWWRFAARAVALAHAGRAAPHIARRAARSPSSAPSRRRADDDDGGADEPDAAATARAAAAAAAAVRPRAQPLRATADSIQDAMLQHIAVQPRRAIARGWWHAARACCGSATPEDVRALVGAALAATAATLACVAVLRLRIGAPDTRGRFSGTTSAWIAAAVYALGIASGALMEVLTNAKARDAPGFVGGDARARAMWASNAGRAMTAALVCVANGFLLWTTPTQLDDTRLSVMAEWAFLYVPAVQWTLDLLGTLGHARAWILITLALPTVAYQAFLLALVPCGRVYIGESL